MLSRLKQIFTGARTSRLVGVIRRSLPAIRAKYDAAQTTENNRRHWAAADGLSANAANSPQVRRVLRNRARYEVANNSYARGIVLTLANDTIGTGPRLQMLAAERTTNTVVEREFARWAAAVGLAEKLRTMRVAKAEDGEAFAVLTNNAGVQSAVKLDLRLVEADQVATPLLQAGLSAVDGIVFDRFGNPREYHILRRHPGDGGALEVTFDRVPAANVLHYFRTDRPGQARGIPEIMPALPLFAMLREYSLATLDAAKAAAYFAGVLYTDCPANAEADAVEPMDSIELERNTLLTMPGGWKMSQVHAEQPTTSYGDFKHEILNEIARCLNMPFNVAAGNSSGYNYASGRLDHQVYCKAIRVEQAFIGSVILDRIFAAWLKEAVLIEGLLPQSMRELSADSAHLWFWDSWEHIDPNKEANAQATRLQNHTTTLAEEYAKRGRDWEAELRQRAKELSLMKELGLPLEQPTAESAETTEVSDGREE